MLLLMLQPDPQRCAGQAGEGLGLCAVADGPHFSFLPQVGYQVQGPEEGQVHKL